MTFALVILILFLPLLASAGILMFARNHPAASAKLSIGAVVISFLASVALFRSGLSAENLPAELAVRWLNVGDLDIAFGFRLDLLTLLMLVVVTGVASAIHLYSWGYLRGDRSIPRYFACLSFFMFSMLGIIMSNNFAQMFVFWELVGLSSYLLIGFWFERPSAADAAKKAFLTNRVGDFGFLMGILLLWSQLGSVHFGQIQTKLAENPQALGTLTTVVALLVFCGAVGKSAQFPLHVWLPDAMEGPTPVSALIHAATMVAAGVFMLCRVFFLLALPAQWPAWMGGLSWSALDVIAWVGGITALLAALMATQQNDIKRILAYSTLSQLGYMVMAVGLGGPSPAMYHLATHAFFKALLFLGAGSVIVALHHEQDIWNMGALAGRMKVTFWTFLLATLALCGVPPFSGFFSKDEILALAFTQNKPLFFLGLFVAFLTTFYMFRLVMVAFLGPAKKPSASHARESEPVMILPLIALGLPTVLAGFWGIDAVFGRGFHGSTEHAGTWWQQMIFPFHHAPVPALASLGAFAIGLASAWRLYRQAKTDPLSTALGAGSRLLQHRFYLDELYERGIALTQDALAGIADFTDRWIIAGLLVRGIHGTVELTGRILRLFQTGNVQTYAFWVLMGVSALLWWVLR
ncbi:MAG TPA: NADH-quinone oxidoreductase subunit L [Candidatus Paceibacterota bacterium]|nr:NADH-quinone oxidoreductase subunit L [Verrucomicrobiota bacterium]HRY50928.1 NADH-quinone oxidoreductase subunit L [Candidatus Paceibacterota bacterium]HRZ99963.1 NADH-quinone oxidoreductase subunit L [Candidatus Paceibacterota bacterium]